MANKCKNTDTSIPDLHVYIQSPILNTTKISKQKKPTKTGRIRTTNSMIASPNISTQNYPKITQNTIYTSTIVPVV